MREEKDLDGSAIAPPRAEDSAPALTPAEARVLDFIKFQIRNAGYPPTYREICTACGFTSTNAARGFIDRLERKGFIERDYCTSRGLRVVPQAGLPAPTPSEGEGKVEWVSREEMERLYPPKEGPK